MQPAHHLVTGPARSRCLLAQTFSTAAWSSARTGGQARGPQRGDRHRPASLGSFLFTFPLASSRTRAASLGGTSSTCPRRRPAAGTAGAPGPPAPSTAQVRSGQAVAQASSCWPARRRPAPVSGPGPPPRPDRHRGVRSLVRVHPDHHCRHQLPLPLELRVRIPWRACLISDRSAVAPLSSHTTAGSGGWHIVIKPGQQVGRRFGSQPTGPFKRYDQNRSASMNN